jgi:hypothetical protein
VAICGTVWHNSETISLGPIHSFTRGKFTWALARWNTGSEASAGEPEAVGEGDAVDDVCTDGAAGDGACG